MPLGILLCFVLAACAASAPAVDLLTRAAAFMDAYGHDLSAGRRDAIADRYSRSGAIFLREGRKEDVAFAKVAQEYGSTWAPPSSFRWHRLAYDAIGDRIVLVTGAFTWVANPDAKPACVSYAAILVVEEGQLRIRLEDETPQPAPCTDGP